MSNHLDLERLISVTGSGQASAPPDTATVDLAVGATRPSVADARTAVASRLETVLDTLARSGVEEDDIASTYFSIHPEYDHRGNRPRITGFRTEHTLTVTVRSIDSVGAVIDAVTDEGGDEVMLNGVTFTISDPERLVVEARSNAYADAVGRATHIATLAGGTLGRAVRIDEQPGGAGPRMARMAAMESGAATSFVPGESTVNATLTVTFALED